MTEDETIRATIGEAITEYRMLADKACTTVLNIMPTLPPDLRLDDAIAHTTLGIIKDTTVDLTVLIIQRLKDKGFAIGAFE